MERLRRVLIVRLGALGDVVHAIPVAAALRRAWPDVEIDWLVSAQHREILELVTCLDRVVVVNDRGQARGGRSILGAISDVRARRYDAVLDLQGLIKSALIARMSGAVRVIGFCRGYLREPWARVFYTQTHDPGGAGMFASTERRHVVHINLGLLTSLGVDPGLPEFPIRPIRSAVADEVRRDVGGRYALLNPGAAWPNKRWPAQRFGALAERLQTRAGLPSVVLWGPGERALGDEIVAHSRGAARLSPQTTIADLVALARGADVMLSGDTGPTHIAAAVGTPIVGIFGPTRPERNGPWAPGDVSLSRADVCSCHHARRCVAPRWCLLDLPVDEVLSGVERRLAAVVPARG